MVRCRYLSLIHQLSPLLRRPENPAQCLVWEGDERKNWEPEIRSIIFGSIRREWLNRPIISWTTMPPSKLRINKKRGRYPSWQEETKEDQRILYTPWETEIILIFDERRENIQNSPSRATSPERRAYPNPTATPATIRWKATVSIESGVTVSCPAEVRSSNSFIPFIAQREVALLILECFTHPHLAAMFTRTMPRMTEARSPTVAVAKPISDPKNEK